MNLKKLLSIVLCIAMIMSSMSIVGFADEVTVDEAEEIELTETQQAAPAEDSEVIIDDDEIITEDETDETEEPAEETELTETQEEAPAEESEVIIDDDEIVVEDETDETEEPAEEIEFTDTQEDASKYESRSSYDIEMISDESVAKVGNTEYATIEEAILNWTNGTTLTLMDDVTLSDVITLSSTEYHILNLGTYTMTAASKMDAIQIANNGRSSASYALDIKADATNPGGITASGKAIVRTSGKSGVKDRPIIRFYGGEFNASYIVYHTGSNGTNCPQFQFHGGEFNGTIYTNRALNQFYGGTFTGSLMMSVDSSAYTLIAGGTFKQLSNLYMSALNSDKFTIGSSKGNFNREVYIDDNGNYVIASAEPNEGIEAAVAKSPTTNDYLKYSKVGTEGCLNYTDVYVALEGNKKGTVTVFTEELDLSDTNFTGTIVVPEGKTITIVVEEGVIPAWTLDAPEESISYKDADGNELVKGKDGSFAPAEPDVAVKVDGVNVKVVASGENSYDITLADGETWTEGDSVTMTFPATGEMAYVVHEHNGTNYIYVGKVEEDTITITNTVGFSTFTVYEGGLEEAFAEAGDGDTIVLLADAAPTLTSQRAITKAAVIDLGGNTLTLTEDDLYFGTTTFKNGTIVVDPSVKASTAVFWMFAGQTLIFDDVEIIATGVTGTYLIGINGGTGTAVELINGSKITIANTEQAGLTAVICDNGTGNSIVIEDSTIDVANIEGRFYLGGANGTITVEDSTINANGVKEGFYLRAGQILSIEGTSDVNITLNSDDGRYGINVTDDTATYTKADTATVDATIYSPAPTEYEVTPETFSSVLMNAPENSIIKLAASETAYEFYHWAVNFKNITIIGAEGATVNKFQVNGTVEGLVFENVVFTAGVKFNDVHVNGLTFDDCTFNVSGVAITAGNSASAPTATRNNVTIQNCIFNGSTNSTALDIGKLTGETVIMGNTFTNVRNAFQMSADAGSVLIDNNTITNTSDRAMRLAEIGENVTVTISNNIMTNACDSANEFFKVTSVGAGSSITFTGNTYNGVAWNPAAIGATSSAVSSTIPVAEVNGVYYGDIQEAIVAAAPEGTVEILADITVDQWIMFAETMSIGNGKLITLNINGLTINGNGKTLTIKSIESAGNGNRLFYDAQNLTINNLTIAYVDDAANQGGIGLQSGTLSGVNFVGGGYGVLPGDGEITITGCNFQTNSTAIYYEVARDDLVVNNNTFELGENVNVILLRGDTEFTNNTIVSGRTVNVVSGSPVVTGNDFGNVRLKVYNEATATIEDNEINVLAFNDDSEVKSNFVENTLSEEAQAVLDAATAPAGLSGSGTAADPYLINNIDDLKWFRDDVNAGNTYDGMYIKLTSDIDLASEEWTPIGTSDNKFKGNFDGGEKTISNLVITGGIDYYSEPDHYVGLFGYINNGGYLKNLTIENASVTGCLYVGGLVGRVYIGGAIENCHVKGNIAIEGYWYVGGIAGRYEYGSGIYNCSVDGSSLARTTTSYIEADKDAETNKDEDGSYVGGIVGFTTEPNPVVTISGNAVSNITINGVTRVGGISGIAHQGNVFSNNTVDNVTINVTQNETILAGSDSTTIGLIAGACQGTDSSPVKFTNCSATNTTVYLNGEVYAVGLYGDNINGETPVTNYVAQIGTTVYETLADAIAEAQSGDTITMLADTTVSENVTLPAGITFNGNGKKISRENDAIVYAGGDLTFEGYTTIANFNANGKTINIGEGATLETTDGRMVIGHGATFNITGSITDAKTANVADLTPSLIMPGASFTGAGVTFNVTNAYIKTTASYCSSSSSASGTYDFNINNSVWEQFGKLAFESQSTAATVNFELKNSVLTTTSHLVFGVSRGEIVIDNSNVNVGTSRQIENQSTMTVKNGSIVNGAVATSSNAKNPGTLIVDNATYAVTGEFSGSDLGTGTIIVKKGANFSAGSITKANIKIDATGMTADDEIKIDAKLDNFAGTLEVINNDTLEAKIVDGKIVLSAKPVAMIGETPYVTLADAIAAAQPNDTIVVINDITNAKATVNKAVTIDLGGKTLTDAYIIIDKVEVTIQNGSIENTNESYPLVVQNGGKLTINDVAIEASKSDRAIWVRANSSLVFNSGSILATKGEGNTKTSLITAIYTDTNTDVTIKGGTITVDTPNNKAVGIYGNYTNANVTMEGGKISTSGKGYNYGINVDGDITVNGGEIVTNEKMYTTGNTKGITNGNNYALVSATGDVTITDGTITTNGSSGYIVSVGRTYSSNNQTVEITGGTFTNKLTEIDTTVGGHKAPVLIWEGSASTVTATITDGNFTGFSADLLRKQNANTTLAVSGGTFDPKPDDAYAKEGYEFVENDNGTWGVIEVELKEFFGTNLTLGNELDINFAFNTSYVENTGYAEIVRSYADDRADETITVQLSDCNVSGSYYVIKYAGIAAKEMCDKIEVTVYDANGKQISVTRTDSIRDYILRNVDNENIATTSTRTAEETRTLLIDMLNYGAAAQTNFEYNTDDLANSTLTAAQKAYGTQTNPTCVDTREVTYANTDKVAYLGTQFVLESKISMRIAILTSEITDGTADISFVDHYGVKQEVTINAAECETDGSYTLFKIDEIVVADGRCDVTCVFKNADGEEVVTVVDSMESYVARNGASYPWLYEIMKFSDAAYASFH